MKKLEISQMENLSASGDKEKGFYCGLAVIAGGAFIVATGFWGALLLADATAVTIGLCLNEL